MDMPECANELTIEHDLELVPNRFKRTNDEGEMELMKPTPPAKYLRSLGFPPLIADDDIHAEMLPRTQALSGKPFLFLYGDFYAGKTTIAANAAYWLGYMSLAKTQAVDIDRFDTAQLISVLCLAEKIGLANACDRVLGGEQAGEEFEKRVHDALEYHGVVILDDFNLAALRDEHHARKLSEFVINRFMWKQPTWLISNDTPETLAEKFPRLGSRVLQDPRWALIELGPAQKKTDVS